MASGAVLTRCHHRPRQKDPDLLLEFRYNSMRSPSRLYFAGTNIVSVYCILKTDSLT